MQKSGYLQLHGKSIQTSQTCPVRFQSKRSCKCPLFRRLRRVDPLIGNRRVWGGGGEGTLWWIPNIFEKKYESEIGISQNGVTTSIQLIIRSFRQQFIFERFSTCAFDINASNFRKPSSWSICFQDNVSSRCHFRNSKTQTVVLILRNTCVNLYV